ncbi:MAG: thioredoxin family protein [Rivularia sp. (in: Bacteria)]|nr:thioredoxin family protein [Rivularia sp. MS3]
MSKDSSLDSQEKPEATFAIRLRNFLIVSVAAVLCVALFIGLRSETSSATLADLDENSIPLEVALSNGKPSLIEFYANWCTVCQKMAPDIATLETEYADKVNFVMLNVDNSKWLPEMLQYRVDGIPHFVFLDKNAQAQAETIGDQPRTIMGSNLEALIAGSTLPYAQANGRVSQFSTNAVPSSNEDPRSHGAQVVN